MTNDPMSHPVEAQDPPYESPSVERVVTADDLAREAQYAGPGSGADDVNF